MKSRPPSRLNDAQIERLLRALKTDPEYRKQLAKKIAAREGIKPASASRRLQRYITEAGEKRSIVRAPKKAQVEFRKEARALPTAPRERPPMPQREIARRKIPWEREKLPPRERAIPKAAIDVSPITVRTDVAEVRANLAWFDGDADAARDAVGGGAGFWDLLASGANVSEGVIYRHGPRRENLDDFYDTLSRGEQRDLAHLVDLFHSSEMNENTVSMLMQWLRDGEITAGEMLDAWAEDGYDFDVEDSAFWEWFRRVYGKHKK